MSLLPPAAQQLLLLREENNEDIKTTDQDLETIKQWLRKQPHLPDYFDDNALLNFLRSRGFSLEKTKRKLDMYFTVKAAFPEFFTNRNVTNPELSRIPKIVSFAVIPRLTAQGRRITILGNIVKDFNPEDVLNYGKLLLMVADVRVHVEEGVHDIFVIDATAAQLKNLPNVPISVVKKFLTCVLEAYPVKIKEIHVVNATPFVALIIRWMSHFIKDKILKRILIHPNLESLHESIPVDLLPEEYGGTAGNMEDFTKEWMLRLEEKRDWFEEQESLKADERKRLGKDVPYGDFYGVEGSFKRLMID